MTVVFTIALCRHHSKTSIVTIKVNLGIKESGMPQIQKSSKYVWKLHETKK